MQFYDDHFTIYFTNRVFLSAFQSIRDPFEKFREGSRLWYKKHLRNALICIVFKAKKRINHRFTRFCTNFC
jgi:hypothetical protein